MPMASPVRRHLNLSNVSLARVYIKDVKHGYLSDGTAEPGPDMP